MSCKAGGPPRYPHEVFLWDVRDFPHGTVPLSAGGGPGSPSRQGRLMHSPQFPAPSYRLPGCWATCCKAAGLQVAHRPRCCKVAGLQAAGLQAQTQALEGSGRGLYLSGRGLYLSLDEEGMLMFVRYFDQKNLLPRIIIQKILTFL